MPASTDSTVDVGNRVVLFVTTRKDAEISARLLRSAGLPSTAYFRGADLAAGVREGAAAILATEVLLERDNLAALNAVLDEQEEWSDLPIILLLHDGRRHDPAASLLQRGANLIILERPTGMQSVLSAVQAAVRARRRQYEARAHIDALKAAEAKAREADRAKTDFLAALSHELRTPLTPVLLTASEALTNPELDQNSRDAFHVIVKNIGLEARLIDDLLDLTRITHRKLKIDPAALSLRATLRDSLATVRPEIGEKQLTLVEKHDMADAVVMGDATRLQQVFWNVLRNAVKFTPPGGTITIHTRRDAGNVIVTVTDTGIGMEPEEVARAFDAFAQGEHARRNGSHRFGGLGLGLAISRSLVTMHGGEITARSLGRGKGAAFEIVLPAVSDLLPAPPAGVALQPARSRALRVLLVEDHESSRETLRRILLARGYSVVIAGSVAEARTVAEHDEFDLLLTDLGLPDGSGHDLLRELPPRENRLAIALTGYGMEEDIARSKDAGFFAHITKPLRAAELDAVLGAVISALPDPIDSPRN